MSVAYRSHLQITASFDNRCCCGDRIINVMMLADNELQSSFIAHDITGEVPLVTKDVCQQFLVCTRWHAVQTNPQTPQYTLTHTSAIIILYERDVQRKTLGNAEAKSLCTGQTVPDSMRIIAFKRNQNATTYHIITLQ